MRIFIKPGESRTRFTGDVKQRRFRFTDKPAHEKTPCLAEARQGVLKNPGNTYFRVCCTIIGSESLTTVFGMGTGVAFPIWSPGSTAAGDKTCRGEFVVVRWRAVYVHGLCPVNVSNVST